MIKTTAVNPSACPGCQKVLTKVSDPFGYQPKKGDIAVCWYCGAINVFGDELILCASTDDDMEGLSKEHLEFIRLASDYGKQRVSGTLERGGLCK